MRQLFLSGDVATRLGKSRTVRHCKYRPLIIRLQEKDFDLSREVQSLVQGRDDVGAVVTFTGIVRNCTGGGLRFMELEHYPGMTERALTEVARKASDRWSLNAGLIIHRFGQLAPGDRIMMVATVSAHRSDAFQAAEFLMDYLKSRAPFWKKEHTDDGACWVASRTEDETALERW